MYQVHYLNKISPKGTALWTENYKTVDDAVDADAILVRSAAMHDMTFSDKLQCIARAGAGVNNIPLQKCAEEGIVVFNTPGANARSVMELTLCGLLLSCRDVIGGINWVKENAADPDIAKSVEKNKSKFAGHEILGRKLGVVGLGAVGGPLANAALKLGMSVYGHDPFISIDAAWHLDSHVTKVNKREEIFESCDIISLHTPLVDDTRKMINKETIASMKDGVIILNFARDLLVDDDAMAEALASGKVLRYITDFPNGKTASMPGCIAIPHLGASTEESEDNCAKMAVHEVMEYLENGNIINSVNFPNCDMGRVSGAGRICILHKNIPNSLSRFTSVVSGEGINIAGLMNKSRGEYAVTMLDLDHKASENIAAEIEKIEGVLRVRVIG